MPKRGSALRPVASALPPVSERLSLTRAFAPRPTTPPALPHPPTHCRRMGRRRRRRRRRRCHASCAAAAAVRVAGAAAAATAGAVGGPPAAPTTASQRTPSPRPSRAAWAPAARPAAMRPRALAHPALRTRRRPSASSSGAWGREGVGWAGGARCVETWALNHARLHLLPTHTRR